MKLIKITLILNLSLFSKCAYAFNFGAPASTQPGWESGGFGFIGLLMIALMVWLFWPKK